MKYKNYKVVSLYSFFPFQEDLILELKDKLINIESKNDLSTTPNVKIEKIEPLTNNLEDDQKLSNALKQIEKLKEEIKKQSQVIQELKSN